MKPIIIVGKNTAGSAVDLLRSALESAGVKVQVQEDMPEFPSLDQAISEGIQKFGLSKQDFKPVSNAETLLSALTGSSSLPDPFRGLGGRGLGLGREESLHILLTRKGPGYPYTVASTTLFRSQEAAADAAATLPDFKLEQEYFAAEVPPSSIRNLKSLLPKNKPAH